MPPSRRRFVQGAMASLVAPALLRDMLGRPALAAPVDPFLDWFAVDQAVCRRVMSELTSRGADFADLYFQHSRTNAVSMEDGLISRASSTIDQGVGLRVVVGDQTGYAYTEDLSEEAMRAAARTAATIASSGAVTPPKRVKVRKEGGLYRLDVPWSALGIDQKLPLVTRIEALAKSRDPSIVKVGVSWTDVEERVLVADLRGNVSLDARPMFRIWCTITARRGDQTVTNSSNLAGRHGPGWLTEERIQTLVQQAVDRTLVLFEARRPPAGELPVVLAAGASGILLHEAIGHGMEADFNRKGTSIYSTMIGQRIGPEFVTIVDNGTLPNERGSLNIDDEGNPTERTVLVEGGILRSYLHDQISARHYGVPATGSGRRESFRHTILPRMRCTYMENGPHTREEIIASVQNGILAETFTNGQVQIGAGDFTFYIKNGWLIEGGRLTAPIKDVNIIGNGPEALKNVTMAANDAKLDTGGWTCGKDGQGVPVSQGLPTVLVSRMTVGGVDA